MMRGRRPRPRSIFNPLGLSHSRQASLDAVTKGLKEPVKAKKKKAEPRCEAMTTNGARCKHPAFLQEHVCAKHLTRRKRGYRRKW